MRAVVTFSLGKQWEINHKHNVFKKVKGPCPIDMAYDCTDYTGAHHSVIIDGENLDDIEKWAKSYAERFHLAGGGTVHITRIETIRENKSIIADINTGPLRGQK